MIVFRRRLCDLLVIDKQRFAYFSLLAPKLHGGPVLARSRAEFLDRTRTVPTPATGTRTIRIPNRTVHRGSFFALSKPMTPVEIKSRASVVSPTSHQTNSTEAFP